MWGWVSWMIVNDDDRFWGLLEALNDDDPLGEHYMEFSIDVEPLFGPARPFNSDRDLLGPHDTFKQRLRFKYSLSDSSEGYRWSGALPLNWPHLPTNSWSVLDGFADRLKSDPPWLPKQSTPKISTVPAPILNYARWGLMLLLVLAILAGGFTAVFWDRTGSSAGWMVFAGAVMLVIGVIMFVVVLDRLSARWTETRAGFLQLIGNVDRKWQSDGDQWGHLRVEGLPFEVADHMYDTLTEGDKVVVTFRPETKQLVGLDILGKSPEQDSRSNT
jgi:hypothetical protein